MVIVVNTIFLALDSHPAKKKNEGDEDLNDWFLGILAYANHFFTLVFVLEVLFKIIGLGLKEFIKEKFNQFDLAIVIMSLLQMEL